MIFRAQNQRILAMLTRGSVTALNAERVGIHRLSARIYDLRHDGFIIEPVRRTVRSR